MNWCPESGDNERRKAVSDGISLKDGHGWRILFVCPATKKRRTVRLGRGAKKNAETARHMIEKLIEAKRLASAIDPRTAAWLAPLMGS